MNESDYIRGVAWHYMGVDWGRGDVNECPLHALVDSGIEFAKYNECPDCGLEFKAMVDHPNEPTPHDCGASTDEYEERIAGEKRYRVLVKEHGYYIASLLKRGRSNESSK